MNNFIISINKILKTNYPLKISFDKINSLSHFEILSNNYNKFLVINMNIDGIILNGQYKNYQIVKVITTEIIDWKKYLLLYVSFLRKSMNPCINETKFIYLIHTYNYINILNIKKLLIKSMNTDNIIEYTIDYTDKINYKLPFNIFIHKDIIKKDNHFYLESFSINNNYKKLKIEIDRLIKNRDKYRTIHFYLNNNGGGDIVPVHIILRCLIGKKENWMKNIKKILKNKKILEWNCWEEESINSPNYNVVKQLNLDNLPHYESKYNGKIYLHMDKQNGSATWFFITYLIYSFSNKINRYSKKCYGQIIKYGTIESDKLKLLGHSGTTSGDGNSVLIKNNNIEIKCPTEQFIYCSVKKNDWNRFWIEKKYI
jgi:hypothetical protein